MKEPIFTFDERTGMTACIMEENNKTYVGWAVCHPDDKEFCNRRVGEHIAITRAYIQYLKDLRDTVNIELKAFKQFYSCIEMNKNFTKKCFAVKSLLRTINKLELELSTIRSEINQEKEKLRKFTNDKNILYRKLEEKRGN